MPGPGHTARIESRTKHSLPSWNLYFRGIADGKIDGKINE